MKLKNIALPVIGLALGASMMTSCNDDFLEKYPQTSLTEQNAFQTYENFRAYMYNCYGLFTNTAIWTNHSGTYYYDTQWSSDFYSGLMTNRENSYNPYAWQNITTVTSSGNWGFGPIRTVNIMLSHLDESSMNDIEKRHWRSVGYFFHSWWYMELVNKYGDIPYCTQVLTDESPEAYGPRTPRKEVADSIIARLEYAIANIGDCSNDGDNPVTADACRAALSRFLLREGTWAKYHGLDEPYQQYLEKCLTVSQELMNKYPTLYTGKGTNKYPGAGYDEIMTTEDLTGVPGVIMFKQYNDLLKHRFSDLIHVEAHRCDAPQHTVDMFLMANGKPINNANSGFEGGEGKDLYDYFHNRDPRLLINFQPPHMVKLQNFSNPDNVNTFKKWRFYNEGEKIGNFTVTAEYADKLKWYINYLGANTFCENGTGDENIGCKRLPGHNWGGSMSSASPNISNWSQTENYMRCWTGYYFWKHFTMWEVGSNDYYQTSDKPIFTIEEVLLNYAEAAFELNRFNQSVADQTINKLRDRVSVGRMQVAEIGPDFDPDRDKGTAPWTRGYDAKTNYEVDPVLWEIRRERMIELFGQGFAFYDIRRWHKAPYYVNRQPCGAWVDASNACFGNGRFTGSFVDYNEINANGYAATKGATPGKGWIYTYPGPLSTGKGWLDTYYLWMVPTYEITMNPELTQNPGYEELFGKVGADETEE
ncbi:MAG: RagB/SusD family nutrient uptake outer membrane protein [Muribaculaceae bacterium]|nr:RagB/SusD family nutrient uptake outer membrane protein [Muribaculaceae bacterium]